MKLRYIKSKINEFKGDDDTSLLVYLFKEITSLKNGFGKGYFALLFDMFKKKKKYKVNFREYYKFEFDKLGDKYADTFLSWENKSKYLKLLNSRKYYILARNKYLAHCLFNSVGIKSAEVYLYYEPTLKIDDINNAHDYDSVVRILKEKSVSQFVVKDTEGSHGEGVFVVKEVIYEDDKDVMLKLFNGDVCSLRSILKGYPLLFEELICQTEQMASFNPSSVNTIRFMTVAYPNGEADVIATFIKIGRKGACVDNAGAGGNVDAAIDIQTGRIYNVIQFNGWRKRNEIEKHPDTGVQLEGIVIEDWDNIKNKVLKYQQSLPFLKAAGWDIALTKEGPIVIEVNDFWDETGQLFLQKGWKKEIEHCYKEWKYFVDKV